MATNTKAQKKRYIISTTPVDKFTKLRKRILLTPAVCEICGFDLLTRNELPAWDDLTPEEKQYAIKSIEEHKEKYHSTSNAQIVDEDELPEHWLGEKAEEDLKARRRVLKS